MNRSILAAPLLLLAASVVALAQPAERRVVPSRPDRPRPMKQAPKSMSTAKPAAAAALRLRGGAVATGLSGFYDYQSNGGSPGYIAARRGTPDALVTTYMISGDASGVDGANAARRVGYAFSTDGGVTWSHTSSIFDLRLGFPYLQLAPDGRPYIAAHGDLGEGDRAFLFASDGVSELSTYIPLAELPLTTESGREGGVAWPTFVVTKDGSKAVVVGSYSNEEDEPTAPLQVATVSLADGSTLPRWRNLTDSVLSNTSGGRTVIARSESGRIGVAWFKYALDSLDDTWGVYYAQSDDDATTWSAPVAVLTGEKLLSEFGINGDDDTVSAIANLDLAFRGDEPQLAFVGNINGLIQFTSVLFWSPSTDLRVVAISNEEPGLGGYAIPLEKRQLNMGSLAYPTVSVGDDGQRVVVAFSAIAQRVDPDGAIVEDAVSADGFQYYRLWGVGSADAGATWGRPFVIQDLADKGTDSASIEYPAASESARVTAGTMELPITYQARRYPGMYIYTGTGKDATDAGPMSECAQYFQRFVVTPSMFGASASVSNDAASSGVVAEVLPNRTSGAAMLEITLPRATSLDVSIVDALGRTVARPFVSDHVDAGYARVAIDASPLPTGLYHCVVRHEGGVVTARVRVER